MPKVAKPFRKPGSTTFYLRRRVPQDLRAIYPQKNGIILRSLGTDSPTEAARLFPAANAALEAEFAAHRQSVGLWPAQKTQRLAILADLAEGLLKAAPESARRSFRYVTTILPGCGFNPVCEDEEANSPELRMVRMSAAIRMQVLRDLALEIENANGTSPMPVAVRSELMKVLEERLPAFIGAWSSDNIFSDHIGKRKLTPPELTFDPQITLNGLQDLWVAARNRPPQTIIEATQVVADFVETFGTFPAKDITIDDLAHFKGMLLQLPKNLSNRDVKLPLAERLNCRTWKDEQGVEHQRPKVSAQTVAKKMSLLKAILGVKVGEGKRVLRHNPAEGLSTGHRWDGTSRDQLTASEAADFFTLPLFTAPDGWAVRRTISDLTLAWLALLGLVSSGRLGEIAQLRTTDIIDDGEHVALDITAYTSSEDEGGPEKKLKTMASRRVIVLPSCVLDLGFLDFVEAVRAAGHKLLFPDLVDRHGKPSAKEVSRRLNQLLDQAVPRENVAFHSLRHNWKAAARRAGLDRVLQAQLSGHALVDVGDRYGKAFIEDLADAINKMTFATVGWSALQESWASIAWKEQVRRAYDRLGLLIAD